jgi:hypothetical protein
MQYTWCNWMVQTNFGQEFHIPKQTKKSVHISMCLGTFNLCYSLQNAV